MRFPNFIGPSYQMHSINVDNQRCINLYAESDEQGTGKEGERWSLVGTPGQSVFATIDSGPIRGQWVATNNILYAVSGMGLYSVSASGVGTLLGTLLTSSGQVGMSDNGNQLLIVDGPNGYLYTFSSNSFAVINDPNFSGATQVINQDTYFLFNIPGTNQFGYTNPGNGPVTFAGLNIASKQTTQDLVVGILSDHRNFWLLGTKSIEAWYDSGDATNPWQPINGGFIESGLVAPFSLAKGANTFFWLNSDDRGQGTVFMASGYAPVRVSTHAIEQQIQNFGVNLNAATSYCYQEEGHNFYVLNFPNAPSTLVFDATEGVWHERCFLNNGILQRQRGDNHSFAYGMHILGDYQNGNLYQASLNLFSDFGNALPRIRVAPHLAKDQKRIFYNSFQLDIESGVGLDGTGQGTNPQAVLEFSNDSGHTWSTQAFSSIGQIGQTRFRALWRRLGHARNRVFRVTLTDPVKTTLIGADLDFEMGAT